MTVLSFECFADRDVFGFLKEDCGLALAPHHAGDQGRVIHAVLVAKNAKIGLVDEDPHSTHHRRRDELPVLKQTDSLVVRGDRERTIIIVKGDLEHAFRRSMDAMKLKSALPGDLGELHRILGLPHTKKHHDFRDELRTLHAEARRRNRATLVTDLEDVVREVLARADV